MVIFDAAITSIHVQIFREIQVTPVDAWPVAEFNEFLLNLVSRFDIKRARANVLFIYDMLCRYGYVD